MEILYSLVIQIPILLFSITIHEFAHGWVAEKFGDDTARVMGRLTLNPIAHIDLIGTIVLPIIAVVTHAPVFGWAKPVPVDQYRLRNPKRDMIFVGLGGPAANFLAAILFSTISQILIYTESAIFAIPILNYVIVLNVILGVFNLLPVPPLDGSQILSGLLPPRLSYEYQKIMPYGIFIIMFLLISGTLSVVLWPVVTFVVSILGVR